MTVDTSGEAPVPGGDDQPPPRRRVGRWVAGVAVVLVILLAGATWAVVRFLAGGGPLPATVMPANTLVEITLDLDPPAGQKVDALRTLRKIPDLRKDLRLDSVDDLRRGIVETALGSDCAGDYDKEIKPWLGQRAGFALTRVGGRTLPEFALQITDKDKARTAVRRLASCVGAEPVGFAVTDDYLVASSTAANARALLAAARRKPLSDDAAFRKWTDAAGGRGVLNGYLAAGAMATLVDGFGDLTRTATREPGIRKLLSRSAAAALSARVRGDGIELSAVTGGAPASSTSIGAEVSRLPDDAVAVLGIAVSKGVGAAFGDGFVGGLLTDGSPRELKQFERASGLDVRRDLPALLGHGLVGVVGGTPPADMDTDDVPPDLEAAVVSTGEPAQVRTIIGKLTRFFGIGLADIGVSEVSDAHRVVIGRERSFNESLLREGHLGDQADFKAVVSEPARASSILFLRLNDAWRQAIVSTAGPADSSSLEADLAPLRAFGLSVWSEGHGRTGTSHLRARLLLH